MNKSIRSLWHGLRLVCPSCETGRIYAGMKKCSTCQTCGVRFERSEEGDFLVTVVAVYSTTAVLISALIFAINFAMPDLNLFVQIALCLGLGTGFALATYRNFKGLSVGLLHATFGLKKASVHSSDRHSK